MCRQMYKIKAILVAVDDVVLQGTLDECVCIIESHGEPAC